jgi:cell division protein FtsI (penicillin-binding protein 3)
MNIGKRRTVTDDEKFDTLNATDIIVHSSNVGISQISWKLSGEEFRNGLLGFGFSHPSGIDLSRDLPGRVKKLKLLNNQMHRANSAYGYGMMVTFAQLFKAYSAFNNDGTAVTPRLVDYLEDARGRHYILPPTVDNLHPVGKKAANQIHEILKEVVKRGTGVKAQYPGLEIGGKTGTAHIARHGRYVREYHSSFYGFANDRKGHRYTIGVLVIRAKKWHKYFASQSAVPTFKNTVRIMVEQGFLEPDPTAKAETGKEIPLYGDSDKETEVSAPILPPLPKEKRSAETKSPVVERKVVPVRKHNRPALKPKPHPRSETVPSNRGMDLF